DEVRDDEEEGAEDGEQEEARHLHLRPLGGLLVTVGVAQHVWREAGVLEAVRDAPGALHVALVEARRVRTRGFFFRSGPCRGVLTHESWVLSVWRWTWSGGLGAEPDGGTDEQAEACGPDEEALGNRAEAAQRVAAGVAGLLLALDVGDHVTLVLGRDVVVVEDRHGLRPGLHGRVDVLGGDAGDGRGLLATGESTTLTGAVVAHGAVDAEDLPALAGVALLGVGVLLGRNGGAGAEGGDIGGD